MWYNFLLLFPSGFKEFLVEYTLVFFLVLSYRNFWRNNTIHWSQGRIRSRGSVTKYFVGVISSDSSYSSSVLSPRSQRLRTWGRLPREDHVPNGRFPHDPNVRRGCVWGEFSFPDTIYIYPCDQWIKITWVHFTFCLLLAIPTRNTFHAYGSYAQAEAALYYYFRIFSGNSSSVKGGRYSPLFFNNNIK
jgi:hypothetical protein